MIDLTALEGTQLVISGASLLALLRGVMVLGGMKQKFDDLVASFEAFEKWRDSHTSDSFRRSTEVEGRLSRVEGRLNGKS